MSPFTPLVFLDTWALSGSLRSKTALFGDGRVLVRDEDGKLFKGLKDWRPLALMIDKLRKLPLATEHEFGAIELHFLPPGAVTSWTPRFSEWQCAHLGIVTNPLAFTFCGIAAQSLPIGMLTLLDASAPCCCVNWGESPFYWMTVQFRRKEPSGEDETLGEAVAL